MYNLIISCIGIVLLVYLFFRFRWYNKHFEHLLHVMGIFLFCKKREHEIEKYIETKPFSSILLRFWDWNFSKYIIQEKTWVEANIFFIELIQKMNSVANEEAKKIRDETN